MTTHATAYLWCGDNPFEARSVPVPSLADGETLLTINAATICGSDRHTVAGRRFAPCPSVLGHEGVGRVVESRRADLVPSERIVFSVTAPCMQCPRCRRGLSAKCETVRKTGHEAFHGDWGLSGTYASHIVLRARQPVARIDGHVPDPVASTAACAIATVMAALEAAGDLKGRRVLVNGVGMLGLVAIAVARLRGAATVHARDGLAGRRELAVRAGASSVSGLRADVESVDVALEFSGAPAGVATALEALDLGGVAVLAGSVTPSPAVDLDPEAVVRGWHTIRGVHNYEPRHLAEAAEFLSSHHELLPWDDILAGPFPMSQLSELFVEDTQALRVVVTP